MCRPSLEGRPAALLGACCEVAGHLAGRMDPSLPVFGEQLGVLFQCQGDYLGIWGDPENVGKTPTDLVEGKRSLPVVVAHQRSSPGRSTP